MANDPFSTGGGSLALVATDGLEQCVRHWVSGELWGNPSQEDKIRQRRGDGGEVSFKAKILFLSYLVIVSVRNNTEKGRNTRP